MISEMALRAGAPMAWYASARCLRKNAQARTPRIAAGLHLNLSKQQEGWAMPETCTFATLQA